MLIPINGDKWEFIVLDSEAFIRRHGDGNSGITIPKDKKVYLDRESLDLSLVVHEVTHVYFYYLCLESASLSAEQMEEIACELMEKHGQHIFKLSRKIYKALKDE
jgi:hypothetical protein